MKIQQIVDALTFTNGGMGETFITINTGEYSGIGYKYGRVWFPDENEPILSFDYDVVTPTKPKNKEEFELMIGEILQILLRKAVQEESAIYAGGVDELPTIVEDTPKEEESKIMTSWDYKVPEPEPGTKMSRNLFSGFN